MIWFDAFLLNPQRLQHFLFLQPRQIEHQTIFLRSAAFWFSSSPFVWHYLKSDNNRFDSLPSLCLFYATVLLIAYYWGCTIGAPLTKKGCWQVSKSAQIPVVNSSYLASCGLAVMSQPSVGHIQPSMELLDQAWKLDVLWPQTRLDAQTLQNVEQQPMGTSIRLHIQ